MNHMKFVVLSLAVSVVGCSSKPSDSDIRGALLKQVEIIGGRDAANSQKKELESLKILGCNPSDAGGYVCSWNGPLGAGSGRFVSDSGSWVMVAAGK